MKNSDSNMNPYIQIARIIGMGLIFTAFWLSLLRLDQYLRVKAQVECSKLSHTEQTVNNGASKVTYPLPDFYNKCLERSGIK